MTQEPRGLAVVLTTAASDEQARGIATTLVERKLAACVNFVPAMQSVYRWRGEIACEQECLLVIKTAADLFQEVCRAIRETHSYDLPEMILLPIADADPDVRAWLEENLSPAP